MLRTETNDNDGTNGRIALGARNRSLPRGITVVDRRCSKRLGRHAAVIAGALSAAAMVAGPAHAGFFDFLFGGPDRQTRPAAESYAAPERVAPAPLGPQSVRQGNGDTGHVVGYCVRLCDGQHFPLEHMANATPVETCRAMCPASKTKVYFGSEIGGAAAKDGARYADLDTAFIYRKQLVANCTCNGRDAFGLAPFDLSSDPTLRPGDIVMTKDGPMAYSGKSGKADAYTPVDSAAVAAQLNPTAARVQLSRKSQPKIEAKNEARNDQTTADDDPGTITPRIAPPPPPPAVNLGANARGQSDR